MLAVLTMLLTVSCGSSTRTPISLPLGGAIAPAPEELPLSTGGDMDLDDASSELPKPPSVIRAPDAPLSWSPSPSAAPPAAVPTAAVPPPLPRSATLSLAFISQSVNNCGPASVGEVLSFWGFQRTQDELQAVLRGSNSYGMTPATVPGYVQTLGLELLVAAGGSDALLKSLLNHGFPVIANQMVSLSDHEFHFRPINGFDDDREAFISTDPLLGPGLVIPYRNFDQLWAPTGDRFIVIFPPEKQEAFNQALAAAHWDPAASEHADAPVGGMVDTTPPRTTATIWAAGKPVLPKAPIWSSSPLVVGLVAQDDPGGVGVASLSYSVDGGPSQLYSSPIQFLTTGQHTLAFQATDYAGNRERPQTMALGIDRQPPTTTAVVDGQLNGGGHYVGQALLSFNAKDDLSGVARTLYSINNGQPQPYIAPVSLRPGSYVVGYNAVDNAANVEPNKTLTVVVDPVPQPTPTQIVAPPRSSVPASPKPGR